MKILGISAFYHDSAATITIDGEIIAAAQEERFSRKKHDESFPKHAIAFCLEYSGLDISQLDAIVFYDKPFLKFERLLETYYAFAPKGIRSFWKAIPVWIKEKLFLKKLLKDEIKKIGKVDFHKTKLLFPDHHLSHAASTFYPSPFEEAAILTIDGVGEWATASICHGKGNTITRLRELRFPHSLGLLYSAFTYFLGFRVNSGEYKLMGLAPYGNSNSEIVAKYKAIIKDKLIDLQPDGSVWLNQKYFSYSTSLKMIPVKKWEALFGFPIRQSESELEQCHCDLGLAIQEITEEVVIKLAAEAKRLTGCDNLCLAGGVALNCVANGKLENARIFENLFIVPAAGDAGGSLGAALAAEHIYFEKHRIPKEIDGLSGSYLGPYFSDKEIELMAKKYNAEFLKIDDFSELASKVALKIEAGEVIGWFQGRMEFGPRALGNRSILGDPRNPEMQKKLNLKIKYRESFRPFAPSVLEEDSHLYFEHAGKSPYMLLVHPVLENRRNKLPKGFEKNGIREKLYFLRSDVPSITHVDYSARIQTVSKRTNPRYWELIDAFKKLTGYGLLVNTSFNVRGEPIVCTPEEAYRCLMRTEMDCLVIGDYIFQKSTQPIWKEEKDWKEEYTLD